MNCTNCGNEIPMGAAACPYCGTPAPMNMQQPYQSTPVYSQPAKKNTGKIVGIIAGIVAIIAIFLVLVFVVFNKKGANADGLYVWDDWAVMGLTMELEIDGDEFVMTSIITYDGETETESVEGTVKINGDKITLTLDGDPLVCEYDSKEGTITITADSEFGMEMVFTKE